MSLLSDYTVENYLKAIVKELAIPGSERITTGRLASLLGVTSGTSTTMIKKLERDGYVTYLSHKGCSLTEKGAEYGLRILRRHRLLESFLVRVLNLDWKSAHDEAERLEHSASDTLIGTIEDFLGYPEKDPTGNKIPTVKQTSYHLTDTSLIKAPLNKEIVINRVSGDEDIVAYLQQENLIPLQVITVIKKDEQSRLATILLDGKEKIISLSTLEYLYY